MNANKLRSLLEEAWQETITKDTYLFRSMSANEPLQRGLESIFKMVEGE